MAWTTPRTWASGALTSSALNTDVRDNTTWIKDALTTHGITSDSVVQPVKSARYGVSCAVTSYSVPTATDSSILFASEEWDDDGFHSVVTGTGRLTAPADGTYRIDAWAKFDINGTGYRTLWVEQDSATEYARVLTAAVSTVVVGLHTSVVLELSATEYVRLFVRQNSLGNLNVDARFQMHRIGS